MNKKEFEKFCEILEGKEGCNFKGDPDKVETIRWKCHHDFRHTIKILNKHFPSENTDKFIKHCQDNGGFCDCEILFNVEQ